MVVALYLCKFDLVEINHDRQMIGPVICQDFFLFFKKKKKKKKKKKCLPFFQFRAGPLQMVLSNKPSGNRIPMA